MPQSKKHFTEEERKARQRAAVRRYQAEHREEIKAIKADYREKNREKINAGMREYYEKNRERMRALKKAYYERNKEKINAKAREKKAADKAGSKRRLKYKDFTKEAQGRPLAGTAGLNDRQKAILNRIATAITADDIE